MSPSIVRPNQKMTGSAKTVRIPEPSYPAGEATPLQITDSTPIPILPLQHESQKERREMRRPPRPRSSWYSQPGASSSSVNYNHQGRRISPPPPVPRLTSAALHSLEQRFGAVSNGRSETEDRRYYGSSNPWQHQHNDITNDYDEHSPTSPPNRAATPVRRVSVDAFLSANKYTPVSQYLRDRTWILEPPAISESPPVSGNGLSRRQSIRRSVSTLVDRTVRKGSASSSAGSDPGHARAVGSPENRKSILTARPERRRSSVPALPHLLEDEYQAKQSVGPIPRVGLQCQADHHSVGSSIGVEIGVPYEKMKMGPRPIPVSTLWAANGRQNRVRSQKSRPQVVTACQQMTPTAFHFSKTPVSAAPSSASSQIRSNPLARMFARPPVFTQILQTRTRDAIECSEQGSYLFIGTLRGPTPAGLRTLHVTMDKAIAKYGEVEGAFKGCKEVRKWLRHEERGVIEWTLAYVRGRWGVEV